jgi:predicted O-linked N-acetylglucosamine transferase (SPINDLY family)/glycosyltransferase involved in cell wall biosynthesis
MKSRRSKHFHPQQSRPPAATPPKVDPLLNQAMAHHQARRLAEAEALYRQILQANPTHAIALHLLGVIAYQVGQHPLALQLIDEAIRIDPNYADAYANRGITLHAMQQHQAAIESYDKAIALKPESPDAFSNRGNALYLLHQYQEALESCDRAIALKPNFPEAHNTRGNTLQALEQYQAALESYDKAIALNPNYADAYSNRGNALLAFNLSSGEISKRDSSGRDLVFYCGRTPETWNPEIVGAKGIGGSEEAVIWLSRLLHKRGWNVTVYATCGQQEQTYDGVTWKPYWMWNYRDKQNTTILWRYPHLANYEINSDHVIVDLHDVIPETELTPDNLQRIHRIFVKSTFHRSLFPNVTEDKFIIVPNGIDAQLFEAACDRDPMLLINTSSADRSLEAFLDCFEEIKKQVPEAKAQWAYGWGVWDAVNSADAGKLQWKASMQQRMQQLGVVELGRISHSEVARLYRSANIFAYPSEMAEIDCISLSKAMAAGAIPITTDFAAMREKSGHGGVFIRSSKTKDNWTQPGQFCFHMTGPEQKTEFVREAVNLLRNPPSEQERESMRRWARSTFAWNAVADAWHQVLRPQPHLAALESHDKAIQLNPLHSQAHNNRGSALHGLLQYEAALKSFDQAILLKPDYADAHSNRASTLMALKQYLPAFASFEKTLQLKPDYEYLRGMRLYAKRLLCDWQNSESEVLELEAAIERGEKAALPFATLAFSTSPAIQKQAAEIYVRDKHPAPATPIPSWPRHDRIRIGYFSSDFYNHATSYLMAELFERHDRARFEILGFSFGPDKTDEMSSRVSSAMDRFINVRSMPDRDIAQLSRDLEVDIAIDLKGFTHDHRAGIFSHRAAPVQVNYVGYPGTMGAGFIDYLIADPTLIPESSQHLYSEKIIYLPGSYQPNDSQRPISATQPTRTNEGLPESAFVFCCFNNTYKITPTVFDIWMRILARVDNSALWLLETNPTTIANLCNEAARRNIAPGRLIFARPLPLAEHLARHALADLFLDTAPYNAHTTASDALWTGLPVLTCIGETFASRVAASLLHALSQSDPDLPELIAATPAEFEDLAVSLADNPARLQTLRQHLQQSRATAPLFDTAAYTRHLEAAYTAIFDRHHARLPPGHIHIPRMPSSPSHKSPTL